jgi:hypothetical protein
MGTVAISEALGREVLAGVTIGTDLPEPSTPRSKTLAAVRLDDQALAKMEELAAAPLPDLPPCGDGELAELLRALTILPRRNDDEVTGELRNAFYKRKLRPYPHDAIKFMVSTVLDELNWFPTIAQCLDILARWRRNDDAVHRRASAASLARAEHRARFNDIMRALESRELDQPGIEALPKALRDIGVERGFLRLHDDGTYRARPIPASKEAQYI